MDISKEIKSAIDELDSNQLKSAKKCVEEAKKKGNVGRPSGPPTEESALRSYLRKAKLAVPGKRGRGTLEATKEVLQKRMDFLIGEYKLTKSVLNEVFKEDIEKIKAKEDIVLGPTYKKRESDKKTAAENEVKRVKEIAESKEILTDKRHHEHMGPIPTRPKYDESTKITAAEDLEKAKKKLAKLAKAEEKRLKELKDIEVKRGLVLTEGEKDRQKKETEQMEKEDIESRKTSRKRNKEGKEPDYFRLFSLFDKFKSGGYKSKEIAEELSNSIDEYPLAQQNRIKEYLETHNEVTKENENKELLKKEKKETEQMEKEELKQRNIMKQRDKEQKEKEKKELDEKENEKKELLKKENKEIEDLLEKFKEGGYKSRKQAEELSKSSKANKYPDYTPKIKKYIGRYNKIVLARNKQKELEGSGREESGREGRKSLRQSLVLQLIRPTNLNMNTRDF